MNKLYLVEEYWNNGELYDDYRSGEKLIGIFDSIEKVKESIETYKQKYTNESIDHTLRNYLEKSDDSEHIYISYHFSTKALEQIYINFYVRPYEINTIM